MSKFNQLNAQPDLTMKAVIIYDDCVSVTKAYSSLQHAAKHKHVNVLWTIRLLRVEVLKFPPGAEAALADAIDAHLLVLAGPCAQSFPLWLQVWLEHWVNGRQIKDAALAVVGAGHAELRAASRADLSQFARCHGLSIIFDDRSGMGDGPQFSGGPAQEPGQGNSSSLPQVMGTKHYDDYRFMGDNE